MPEPAVLRNPDPVPFTPFEPEPEAPPSVWARKPEPLVPAKPDPEPIPVFTPGPEFEPISDPEPLFAAEPPTSQALRPDPWLEPPSAAAPAAPSVDTAFEMSFNVPAEAAPEPVLERIVATPAPVVTPQPPVERPMFQALRRERPPEPAPAPPPPPRRRRNRDVRAGAEPSTRSCAYFGTRAARAARPEARGAVPRRATATAATSRAAATGPGGRRSALARTRTRLRRRPRQSLSSSRRHG